MIPVTTAAQAAAMDAKAAAPDGSTWHLMAAAGKAAAGLIAGQFPLASVRGVTVVVGGGNNGGDGWVVAAELGAAGIAARVVEVAPPSTPDATRAKGLASHVATTTLGDLTSTQPKGHIVVDALLGTGARGEPRGDTKSAIIVINAARARGAEVVALDLPSGLDADTGAAPGEVVRAQSTITFGSAKRGLLRNRDASGRITIVDIGLGVAAESAGAPRLWTHADALARVPAIGANAHKGTRGKVLVVGGAHGMAGATILAARAALRSGAGMVRCCVEAPSVAPVQAAVPAALTSVWPADDAALAKELEWATAVVLGPGLGLTDGARWFAERLLTAWRGPVVVDADALNVFEGRAPALAKLLAGRAAIVTPHPAEAARLIGGDAKSVDAGRFDIAAALATACGATALLKGVPTVVSDGSETVVVAAGNPVLATGGSGDVLAGIAGAIVASVRTPLDAAVAAASAHGRAAELAGRGRIRGITIDDVVAALADAWSAPIPDAPPVLGTIEAAGADAW